MTTVAVAAILAVVVILTLVLTPGRSATAEAITGPVDPSVFNRSWRVSELFEGDTAISLTDRSYVVFSYNTSLTVYDGCEVIDATIRTADPSLTIDEGIDPSRYWPPRPWPETSLACAARAQALALRALFRSKPVFTMSGNAVNVVGPSVRAVLEPAEPTASLALPRDVVYPLWNLESVSIDGVLTSPELRLPTQLWPYGFMTDGCNNRHVHVVEVDGRTISASVPTTEAPCLLGGSFASALTAALAGGVIERVGDVAKISRDGIVVTMRLGRYVAEGQTGKSNTALARRLRGTSWRASTLRIGRDVVNPSNGNHAILRFAANGRVTASRDCNTAYATGFRIVGERLVLDKAKVTTVGCRVPNTYGAFATFAQQGTLALAKNSLTFTNADVVLTFVRA